MPYTRIHTKRATKELYQLQFNILAATTIKKKYAVKHDTENDIIGFETEVFGARERNEYRPQSVNHVR